jgi:hypothetical protein
MIAPIHPVDTDCRQPKSLAAARRAVATALFGRQAAPEESSAPVSNRKAWLFVLAAAAIATAYFALGPRARTPWY